MVKNPQWGLPGRFQQSLASLSSLSSGASQRPLSLAELSTAFPGNGGFVIWANEAFGPFWGSLLGSWKFFTVAMSLASYTALHRLCQAGYPNSLFWALSLSCYIGIDGYFTVMAEMIGGKWLKFWTEIGAVLALNGQYQAQLTTTAYQLLGMADIGFIRRIFGVRSRRFDTPWIGILISTAIALAVSFLDFTVTIYSVNFVYSLGMLLEFASFLWLRKKFFNIEKAI
ncbi:Amino acid/polyamine transporter [Quillaja saponaria]|uniref:Amino acid/polyamine transporter n=1 Tax=Quillaja saponaria TaxID=32244 RepID=A0AAD7QGT3_QUISA|nr:Amino acid/polyamine transporter [Quillaja saponaria]